MTRDELSAKTKETLSHHLDPVPLAAPQLVDDRLHLPLLQHQSSLWDRIGIGILMPPNAAPAWPPGIAKPQLGPPRPPRLA